MDVGPFPERRFHLFNPRVRKPALPEIAVARGIGGGQSGKRVEQIQRRRTFGGGEQAGACAAVHTEFGNCTGSARQAPRQHPEIVAFAEGGQTLAVRDQVGVKLEEQARLPQAMNAEALESEIDCRTKANQPRQHAVAKRGPHGSMRGHLRQRPPGFNAHPWNPNHKATRRGSEKYAWRAS